MDRRRAVKRLSLLGTGILAVPELLMGRPASFAQLSPEEAWRNLDKFTRSRYVFRYIEPQKNLPNIFLYGDSISIGYTEYVRTALEGSASVHRLHKNGGSSHDFIENMEHLRTSMFQPDLQGGWDFEWDLIHFNVGLHDLKYIVDGKLDKENGKQVSSIEVYQENLEKIVEYLSETYPDTRLVFATTTPVPPGSNGRFEGDAARYNIAALEVLKAYKKIRINDLYKLVKPDFERLAIKPGNVHFSAEGSRILGERVASFAAKRLRIKTTPIPDEEVLKQREELYMERSKAI